MTDKQPHRTGFTVLDGAAMVLGAAVASVLMRGIVTQEALSIAGWVLAWLTFTGLTITASGVFLFAQRFLGHRPPGYPQSGDWLWLLLGLPWTLAAVSSPVRLASTQHARDVHATLLWAGIILASLAALVVVGREVVRPAASTPGPVTEVPGGPSWTDRLGKALAIAWPLQWGFGLVVLG